MLHIGIIPDGNRRFAQSVGLDSLDETYSSGIAHMDEFLNWCLDLGVTEVTAYVLSLENIDRRSSDELALLENLFLQQAKKMLKSGVVHERGVRVRICGDLNRLSSAELCDTLAAVEDATGKYRNLTLNLAVAYGGRQDILHSVSEVIMNDMPLTEENVGKFLWVDHPPDIIIRTAESRLSNFLTWQAAYSEIYFVEKLWQEFTREDLESILESYASKERRFGA